MAFTVPQNPEWNPLENVMSPDVIADYMFMGLDADALVGDLTCALYFYKHRTTRSYLILDDRRRCFRLKPGSDEYDLLPWTAAFANHPGLCPEAVQAQP